jgi:hypothetical protein
MNPEQSALIKDLASAVSTQAQVANRLWLTLMTVALFALYHKAGPASTAGEIPLLPGWLAVQPADLYPVLLLILAVLCVAFASAHAQQVRAQKLARKQMRHLRSTESGVNPAELFDMLCQPSVIRVAPLAQSLRQKYQFHDTADGCPEWLRYTSGAYYVVLKISAIAIYFLLPLWALLSVTTRIYEMVSWIMLIPALLAGCTVLQVAINELIDGYDILGIILERKVRK